MTFDIPDSWFTDPQWGGVAAVLLSLAVVIAVVLAVYLIATGISHGIARYRIRVYTVAAQIASRHPELLAAAMRELDMPYERVEHPVVTEEIILDAELVQVTHNVHSMSRPDLEYLAEDRAQQIIELNEARLVLEQALAAEAAAVARVDAERLRAQRRLRQIDKLVSDPFITPTQSELFAILHPRKAASLA